MSYENELHSALSLQTPGGYPGPSSESPGGRILGDCDSLTAGMFSAGSTSLDSKPLGSLLCVDSCLGEHASECDSEVFYQGCLKSVAL